VGLTHNVGARLSVHNSGGSTHAAGLRPWELVVAIEFANEDAWLWRDQPVSRDPRDTVERSFRR